jgi:putative oxidoreductase
MMTSRNAASLTVVTWATAMIIGLHGAHRALFGGVTPFALWLDAQGFPLAWAIAAAITTFELIAAVALIVGCAVRSVSLVLIAIYFVGIVLVHAPAGWFVVGAGRNGAEFSVLLMACLAAIALEDGHRFHPRRQSQALPR